MTLDRWPIRLRKIVPSRGTILLFSAVSAISAVNIPTLCRADAWNLTTSDFHSEMVQIRGLDEHGVAVTAIPSQNSHTVPLDQFLELTRVLPLRQHPSSFILRLRSGDLLAGEPVSLSGDSIVWREDITGDMKVPLSDAISFRRMDLGEINRPASANSDDSVKLANGDVVHGVLSNLSGASVSIQPAAGGDATAIPLSSVTSVEFASVGAAAATSKSDSADPDFRIHLNDDSLLTATAAHGDDWTMHLTFAGAAARDVPLSSIQSIEQINGPVRWLSSLTPSENVQTPFLEAEYPARFDRNVLGGPIQFGDRTFAHGIGVHAYSRMSWNIGAGDQQFRTQYAVDGDQPYAQMTVRILIDGKVVHEQKDLRAGTLSPVVAEDLKGAHLLTLEVIDEQAEGVQARLNWIEPAFLRVASPALANP